MTNNRLAQTCLELINIESVSGNEAGVEAYVRSALPSTFRIAYEHDTVVMATTARRPGLDLVLLAGHTDTVPVENNLPARVIGDAIGGRGAADMKAGLAVMLELAQWIDEEQIELDFDLGLLFFGREELSADRCPLAAALRDSAFDGVSLALLMEPTDNAIEAGCMGNLNLRLQFNGVAAHSARPWQGDNAVHKAIIALQSFAERSPIVQVIDGLSFSEVASVTKVNAGDALNVVPGIAEFFVNVRYTPAQSPEDAETQWRNYFEEVGAEVSIVGNARSAPVVLNHPLIQRLQACGSIETRAKQAWTNAADFAARDVPAINFGPGDPAFAHKADEQVSVSALDQSLSLLKDFVKGGSL